MIVSAGGVVYGSGVKAWCKACSCVHHTRVEPLRESLLGQVAALAGSGRSCQNVSALSANNYLAFIGAAVIERAIVADVPVSTNLMSYRLGTNDTRHGHGGCLLATVPEGTAHLSGITRERLQKEDDDARLSAIRNSESGSPLAKVKAAPTCPCMTCAPVIYALLS